MNYLVDANVWVALVAAGHRHHAEARSFFEELEDGVAVFCRVTQMAFVRLITNAAVMGGNPLTVGEALALVSDLEADSRVGWSDEPEQMEQAWHGLMRADGVGVSSWTDAYLAAFALQRGWTLASLDGGYARWGDVVFQQLK